MKYLISFGFFLALIAWFAMLRPTQVAAPLSASTEPVFNVPVYVPISPTELTTLTNQYRASLGLMPLAETAELDAAAMKKCQDMEARNYWAHSINGEAFNQFDPYAAKYGENLAKDFPSSAEVIAAWQNSPTHNANLVDPLYKIVGVATCDGPIKGLVVQELELP